MQNNKSKISCDRLISGIDFELDSIEVCCYRCHEGGGCIELAPVIDNEIDFSLYEKNRNELIQKVSPKCKGCFNLERNVKTKKNCIKYIHFNHWSQCNSGCIYCYTKTDSKYKGGVQHYKALPLLKKLVERYGFSSDGEITFAGGEPVMLDEFDDIIDYLIQINAKKIIVHTSGTIYSNSLANAVKQGIATVVISHDSGFNETYKRIKNTDFYEKVWDNTKKYAQNGRIYSKYVILPKINDNEQEIEEWFKCIKQSGIKDVIVDIEHNYYENNKNNFKNSMKLMYFCEYIRAKALSYGLNTELYNAAQYLYMKYRYLKNVSKIIHFLN